MSRRGFEWFVGGLLLLGLVHRGSEVVLCGLAYAWYAQRRTAEISTDTLAKTAMIGGFVGGVIFDGMALSTSMSTIWNGLKQLNVDASLMTYVPVMMATAALTKFASLALNVFLLGLAIRILAPSLPK